MLLSVVIPVLNEATDLPRLLRQIASQQALDCEVIVVDGGSTDQSVAIASQAGAICLRTARGRGHQMNTGAAHAKGRFLLFLHADCSIESPRLLADALVALQEEMAAAGHDRVAGHFPLRFVDGAAGTTDFYRHLEGKTRLGRPYTINGDQGLLLSAAFFRQLGGFDESLPFLEDQRIATKIFEQGHWLLLPGVLLTSARRFETEGHRERYTLMAILMGLHAADVTEFFQRAPQVYALHSDSGRLQLAPMLQLIRKIFRERGLLQTTAILYRVGRFVRENAWQLAYWRDQAHRAGHLPRLRFYDRWLHPLTRNPLADTLSTLLVCLWFFIWLPLRLQRSDSIHRRSLS